MKASDFTEDGFEAWRELPMTKLVMAGFEAAAQASRQAWTEAAWANTYLTAEERERQLLALNRVQSQVASYREIAGISLADILKMNGMEPDK